MTGPVLVPAGAVAELKSAIVAALRAYRPLVAMVRDRVFDVPPTDPRGSVKTRLPYVSLGPVSYQDEAIDCMAGGEVTIQVDAWSDAAGTVDVETLAAHVRKGLKNFAPDLPSTAVATFRHWRSDTLSSGALRHVSIRFLADVEDGTV